MNPNPNPVQPQSEQVGIYTITNDSIVIQDGDTEELIVLGRFLVESRVQDSTRRGQVQAATVAATGLTYDFFRFLRRPHYRLIKKHLRLSKVQQR